MNEEELLKTPSGKVWKRIGTEKKVGMLIPLFSVYSKKSIGIGDFYDLKTLIKLCKLSGHSILQLLPMNEVGANHCPYDCISSFAIEPSYISIELLPEEIKKEFSHDIETLKKQFPAGRKRVDYRIKEEKISLFKKIFNKWKNLENFNSFIEENKYWIYDFAFFKILKAIHSGKPWYYWENQYKIREKTSMDIIKEKYSNEILFEIWLQYLLYKQFKEVKEYANSVKVFIMGDMPILPSRDSADVWAHQEFFNLELCAGAPPDMYCAKGQRWGMPTYKWDTIEKNNYKYIIEKLRYAENFYDIIRIDHVVGLFRIWSIPYFEPIENQGLNGFFDPPDENLWEEHGRKILSAMIENTNMLLAGEDLGIIPPFCPKVLKEFGIPGYDIQRWTKDWNNTVNFLKPNEYRFCSISTLSTHDTTNWAAWWENEAGTVDEELFKRLCKENGLEYEKTKSILFNISLSKHGRLRWNGEISSPEKLAKILGKKEEEIKNIIKIYKETFGEKEKLWEIFGLKGEMKEKAEKKVIGAALKMVMKANSIFCIQFLIDYLLYAGILTGDPYQYRINTPGTVSENNWSLVLPVSLEELME